MVLGGVVALGLLLLLLLPLFIDANDYREIIEAKAEELLGREVRLGDIKLSVFPLGVKVADVAVEALPEEGGGDLLSARSMHVGARLGPLLGGRLEVTRVVIDGPSIILERGTDGTWNVQRLFAAGDDGAADGGEAPAGSAPAVSVDLVQVTDGQVIVRAATPSGEMVEARLTDLDLEIRDLALDREVHLELTSALSDARLTLQGSAGPLVRGEGAPLRLQAELDVTGLSTARLQELAAAFGGVSIPAGLLGEASLTAGATLSASFLDGPSGTVLQEAAIARLVLQGVEITLVRRADGSWNFDELLDSDDRAPADSGPGGPTVSVGGVELTDLSLRIVDESGDARRELMLSSLNLSVEGLPTEGSVPVQLATRVAVDGKDVGSLELDGSVGPLPRDGGPVPLDLMLNLDGLRLSPAGPYLRDLMGLDLPGGSLSLTAKVTGEVPEAFQVSGDLDLAGVEVRVASPDGATRSVRLDADLFYDLAWSRGGDLLEIRQADLNVEGSTLAMHGSIDISGPLTRVDLTLDPSQIPADDLALLTTALGYPLPVAMSSDRPIGIEARVRGELGGEKLPDLSGKLTLAGFRLLHPSMSQPLEDVGAVVSLRGETVEIRDFGARIGGSDLAGEITARGLEAPQVEFALRSRQADFWELMSFVSGEAEDAAAGEEAAPGSGAGLLEGVLAQGTLVIEAGSFQTLDFSDLDAGLKLEGQVITLDPFSMSLYEGRFRGSARLDLAQEPPTFRIRSDVQEVDVNGLLADNLDLDGVLDGKFQANLQVSSAGADFETIVRGLSGGGSILVTDGVVGKLDLLGVLSRATGVFGENTLGSLSDRLAAEGTVFDRLAGTVQLQGRNMSSRDLVLASPDLVLQGEGNVDLLAATLDGEFEVIFSRALSESMRAEGSRAAQAFWDPKIDQVNLPVTLQGPFAAPTPGIDWGKAAGNVVRRKAEEEVKDRLGNLGGLLGGGDAGGAATSNLAAGGSAGAGAGAGGGLVAEISRIRWGGSFFLKDLKIDGVVRGRDISHASLVVTDSSGKEIERIPRLNEIDVYFAGGKDRSIPAAIVWDATVDGKDLARRSGPYTVILTLHSTDGETREARTQADR